MLVIGKAARVAVALTALALFAGCSDDDPPAPDDSLISVTEMRGALLQANEIGPTWAAPEDQTDPNLLVSICGGTTTAPPAPPGAEVVASPFADEGSTGAQTLNQTALVYPDTSGADAAFTGLQTLSQSCQATVSVPQVTGADRNEPAYTESVSTQQLKQNGWAGFSVLRHKQYEATHPGTADTSVAILRRANVVLVDAYAVYRLGATTPASTSPDFTGDWQRLVGTVVNRVG